MQIKKNIRITKAEEDITGERYLFDNWQSGIVKFANNANPSKYNIKYDIYTDEVVVKAEDNSEMTFSDPISAFRIIFEDGKEKLFRANYDGAIGNTSKSFYEVLYDGKTQLLKKYKKIILESRVYNSGVVGKKFVDDHNYYLAKDGKTILVKNNINAIADALPEKASALKDYVKQNKLNIKNDKDFIKLIAYYNTL